MKTKIIALTAILTIGAGLWVTESFAQSGLSLRDQLKRQEQIAENAHQQVERLRTELKLKDELIDLAIERNADLYRLASEVIEKGISTDDIEPFLQLQRVEMENLKQDYEDRARKARVYATTLPPSVQQKMDEELKQKKAEKRAEE